MGSILHLSDKQKISEAYSHCQPLLYITQPQQAYIFTLNNLDNINKLENLFFSTAALPPLGALNMRTPDEKQPIFIALYPDNSTAIWSATKPNEQKEIITYFTDSVCNGFKPITELFPNGKLLHFSTKDNRFLHLFLGECITGYSYNQNLLTSLSNDSMLNTTYQTAQYNSGYGIIFYNNEYKYADIHLSQQECEIRYNDHNTLPIGAEASPIDTTLIAGNAKFISQFSVSPNNTLAPHLTLAYIEEPTDSTLHPVWVAPIINRNEMRRQLQPLYTPYGFRADSSSISHWIPRELVSDSCYWIATRQDIFYCSPSPAALRTYIKETTNNRLYNTPGTPPAYITIISKSMESRLIPPIVAAQLPARIINKAQIIQLTPTDKGCKYSIKY